MAARLTRRVGRGAPGRTAWLWLRRAAERRGQERETLFLIAKSIIAATLAWVVADALLDSPDVAFAPFSALLVVHPTIYRSVLQSGSYIAAVFTGVLIAGAVGLTVGLNTASLALVVGAALVVSRWSWFGEQRNQLPVVAAFALAGGNALQFADLLGLLGMVAVGAASALLVNLVLTPAVRFRDADDAVLDFAAELRQLLNEMSDALAEGWESATPRNWYDRAARFDDTIRNSHAAVDRQEQRIPFNPRRPRRSGAPQWLQGYRGWIDSLSRATTHVQSINRSLRYAASEGERYPAPEEDFLRSYARILGIAAEALRLVTELDEPDRNSTSPELRACVNRGLEEVDTVMGELGERTKTRPLYGGLLADAERFFEEIYEGHY